MLCISMHIQVFIADQSMTDILQLMEIFASQIPDIVFHDYGNKCCKLESADLVNGDILCSSSTDDSLFSVDQNL